MKYQLHRTTFGFTLLELIVAVSIIAILATVVITNFGPAREQARDAQRQTDLRTIEAALALYKNKYGRYPEACNGPTVITLYGAPNWSGQAGSGYECASGNQYIVGLAPEFLPKLPTDPRLNPDETFSGYVYAVNSEGSVYKFMALNTVESEVVQEGHEFFRCGVEFDSGVWSVVDDSDLASIQSSPSHLDGEICERVPPRTTGPTNSGSMQSPPSVCSDVALYGYSYAVSEGFSSDSRSSSNPDRGMEFDTEVIRCG